MEKKKVEATLLLNYLFEFQKPQFLNIVIDKKEFYLEDVNNKEIKIAFNDIEAEIKSKTIKISLIYKNKINEFNCEIIPGINEGILFPFSGVLRDVVLPENQNYKVEFEYDKDRKVIDIKKIDYY